MSQLLTNNRHDFLLRLAHTLTERGIAHWQTVLKPLLAGGAFPLHLRGLMFSPPLAAVPEAAPTRGCHRWCGRALLATMQRPHRGLSVAAHRADGLLLRAGDMVDRNDDLVLCQPRPDSGNRDAHSAGHHTRLPLAEQLVALHTLQGELERLQYRIRHGTPWYQRFGLGVMLSC